MFALIEPSGRVSQVSPETFDVAEPYVWVECDKSVKVNDVYSDGKFTTPVFKP